MEFLIFLPVILIFLMITFIHACKWHDLLRDPKCSRSCRDKH